MSSAQTASDITLNLDRSRAARPFEEGESLWWDHELKKISRLLKDHQKALEQIDREIRQGKDVPLDRQPTLSIAVQGNHGCGKSSLLKTLVERVNRMERPAPGDPFHGLEAYSLPVLAPGLVAHGDQEQFVYTFLATLWQEIEQSPAQDSSRQTGTMLPLDRDFQRVSEYLQVVHAGDSRETDPWGVSLELLEKHRSGRLLREELQKLVSAFAQIQRDPHSKALIIMPVDDADLSFKRLRSFLNTYRHYLVHPRLVPVVTFSSVLAEELLKVQFANEIQLQSAGSIGRTEDFQPLETLAETYSPGRMARHMASQFLAKYFPIRSRIRLQLGALRVRSARYLPTSAGNGDARSGGDEEGHRVEDLLKAASRFFFGPARWRDDSELIRWPLQPIMLRRQIQVVDALVHTLPSGDSRGGSFEWGKDHRWFDAFDAGAWALLDIHRDVLEPFGFFIEDMYAWTRPGLTQLLRETILSLEPKSQIALFEPWIRGRRSLRSEVLSLLAVHVTRPPMEGEEDFVASTPDREVELASTLSASSALLWFLNLWLDVYLPQILALARGGRLLSESSSRDQAAVTAEAQQAELRLGRRVSGLLHLEPDEVTRLIYSDEIPLDARLQAALWCDFTCTDAGPIAAISLSRGLRLVRRLLTGFVPRRDESGRYPDTDAEGWKADSGDVERVKKMISEHLDHALVAPHYQVKKRTARTSTAKAPLLPWRWQDKAQEENSTVEAAVKTLAEQLVRWRIRCEHQRLTLTEQTGRANTETTDDGWQSSFIRRLHAESLIGDFWHRMSSIYLERPAGGWPAVDALRRWVRELLAYWRSSGDGSRVHKLLAGCPILKPFAPEQPIEPWCQCLEDLVEVSEKVPGATSGDEPGGKTPGTSPEPEK